MKTTQDKVTTLWKSFQKTRSVDARNRLVEHYVPLVHKLAEIIARRLWPRVTADELASAGYDGLIAAVSSFDPKRGVKFETYCRQRIVGAIRDWQREIDPLGRSGRNFERTMNATEERFQAESGRVPTSAELARRMNIPLAKFIRMKTTVSASHSVPLESPGDRNDDSRISTLVPVDPTPGPAHHTERELIREYVTRGLQEQDRLILTLYYYEKLTMAAIGAVLGVSESRFASGTRTSWSNCAPASPILPATWSLDLYKPLPPSSSSRGHALRRASPAICANAPVERAIPLGDRTPLVCQSDNQ